MHPTATFEWFGSRIFIVGELDLASGPALDRELSGLGGQPVVLDLSCLDFIDSCGVHALSRARRTHSGLRIENAAPNVGRVLDILTVKDSLLDQRATAAEAGA
jgi:anti-anti-sigma factor